MVGVERNNSITYKPTLHKFGKHKQVLGARQDEIIDLCILVSDGAN
jgi:hypothetical protein